MRAIPRFDLSNFFTTPYMSRTIEHYGMGVGDSYVDHVLDGRVVERRVAKPITLAAPIPVAYCFEVRTSYAGRLEGFALDFRGEEILRTRSSNRRFLERDMTKMCRDRGYEALWPHIGDDIPELWIKTS